MGTKMFTELSHNETRGALNAIMTHAAREGLLPENAAWVMSWDCYLFLRAVDFDDEGSLIKNDNTGMYTIWGYLVEIDGSDNAPSTPEIRQWPGVALDTEAKAA